MNVTSKREIPQGDFLAVRYLTKNGEKTAVSTYQININNKKIILLDNGVDISSAVRHIIFKNKTTFLMWIRPCKLGMLYILEKVHKIEENSD
jgi:hypothetical protein